MPKKTSVTVSSPLTVTHFAIAKKFPTKISNQLLFGQICTVGKTKKTNSTLLLTQSATYKIIRGTKQALTITQSCTVIRVRPVKQTLTFTQDARGVVARRTSNTLQLEQTVSVRRANGVEQTFSLRQIAICDLIPKFEKYTFSCVKHTSDGRCHETVYLTLDQLKSLLKYGRLS